MPGATSREVPGAIHNLQAIIDKHTAEDGSVWYLALWAAPLTFDDASWEPAKNFHISDIQTFEIMKREFILQNTEEAEARERVQLRLPQSKASLTLKCGMPTCIAPDQPDFENFPKTEADWDRLSDDEFVRVFDSAFGPRLLDLARTHLG